MLLMRKGCQKMLTRAIGRVIMDCTVQDCQGEACGESKWMESQLQRTSTKLLIFIINEYYLLKKPLPFISSTRVFKILVESSCTVLSSYNKY